MRTGVNQLSDRHIRRKLMGTYYPQGGGGGGGGAGMITFETFSDSREAWVGGGLGPDVFDGAVREIRSGAGITNVPASMYLPWIRPDLEIVADGGCSGTELSIWNSGARPDGKTVAALDALGAAASLIQFETNDVQGNVVDAATRDSVAASRRIDINALIANRVAAGKKVVVGTCIQRSDLTGVNAYLTNTAFKRDSVDIFNTNLIADVAANYPSGTQVQVADLRALTNIGGALTGAYVNTTLFPDGCHGNQLVGRRIVNVYNTCLNNLGLTARGVQPMYRATGPNLIDSLTTSNVGTTASGTILSNCTISAPDFSLVNGNPAVTYTVTPSGIGFFSTQIVANVGLIANSPPNTFSTGDKVAAQVLLTVDDGSGGVSACNNIDLLVYSTFTVAPEQQLKNGTLENIVGTFADAAIIRAKVQVAARTMPAGSSEIGAPAFGNGLRFFPFIYFANGAPFRVIFERPEIRVVT
jgi:hypothetical protein